MVKISEILRTRNTVLELADQKTQSRAVVIRNHVCRLHKAKQETKKY